MPELVALGAATAAAVLAVAFPALADEEARRSLDAADAGRIADAVDAADRARLLNPLSLGPLDARAVAADAAGDERAAVAWYERATRLQPENPDPWYDLGLFEYRDARPLRRLPGAQPLVHARSPLDPLGAGRAPRRRARRREPAGRLRLAAEDQDGLRAVELRGRIPSSGLTSGRRGRVRAGWPSPS